MKDITLTDVLLYEQGQLDGGEWRRRAEAAEALLSKWEEEVGKEMPPDFKDWWQNSVEEHPEITRLVLESRRKAMEQLENDYDLVKEDLDDLRYRLNG